MEESWKDGPWLVGVLSDPEEFWRLLRTDSASDDDLRPDSEVRDRFSTEDHCTYRGFSAFRRRDQATEYANDVFNPQAIEAGRAPFSHVVSFRVNPKARHACSWVGPQEGHFSIWADPETLASSLGTVFPI